MACDHDQPTSRRLSEHLPARLNTPLTRNAVKSRKCKGMRKIGLLKMFLALGRRTRNISIAQETSAELLVLQNIKVAVGRDCTSVHHKHTSKSSQDCHRHRMSHAGHRPI